MFSFLKHTAYITAGVIVAVIAMMTSCADDQEFTTSVKCFLVIENDIHQNTTLASAMNSAAPGIFCRISTRGNDFCFENNQGLHSTSRFTALDQQRSKILGTYNESGIIVGFNPFDNKFYAFDAQCRNCYEANYSMPRYLLSMNTAGIATCKSCGREYDLKNDGNVAKGPNGKKLYRFHASTTGELGVLTVGN